MRVLVTSKSFGKDAPDALRLLAEHGIEIIRGSHPDPTAEDLAAEIAGVDAVVVGNNPVDEQVLAAADRLVLVHMHGTGLDGIDVDAATRHGVLVANAPGTNSNAVAELTVALLLVAARSIHTHAAALAAGRWERSRGAEVSGKVVGTLGLGHIGRRVIELLTGFGVQAVAYDPEPPGEWADRYRVDLVSDADEVFRRADFLVLALPLTPATHHLVNAERLALMKPSAYLVNTARGGLVDPDALRDAVDAGRLAGAALDAFDPEPLPVDSPLRGAGLVLTPHIAASTHEAAAEVSRVVARHLVEALVEGRTDFAINAEAVAARGGQRFPTRHRTLETP